MIRDEVGGARKRSKSGDGQSFASYTLALVDISVRHKLALGRGDACKPLQTSINVSHDSRLVLCPSKFRKHLLLCSPIFHLLRTLGRCFDGFLLGFLCTLGFMSLQVLLSPGCLGFCVQSGLFSLYHQVSSLGLHFLHYLLRSFLCTIVRFNIGYLFGVLLSILAI